MGSLHHGQDRHEDAYARTPSGLDPGASRRSLRRGGESAWESIGEPSSIGLGVIVAATLAWQFFVHALFAPTPLSAGIRVDGTQVAIKVPTCPTETVDKVEVFDGDMEERLWAARTPKSPEGKRGANGPSTRAPTP